MARTYSYNTDDIKTIGLLATCCYSLTKVLPLSSLIAIPTSLFMTAMLADYFKDRGLKIQHRDDRGSNISLFQKTSYSNIETRHNLFKAVRAGGADTFNTIAGDLMTRIPKAVVEARTSRP
ncbi:MAG: hypothetical protein P1U63_08930 [Coxiellaceae bacterium]|nr:hypothetical protein [Coxiellaceae bacterium]